MDVRPHRPPSDTQFSLQGFLLGISALCIVLGFGSTIRTFGMPVGIVVVMLVLILGSVTTAVALKKLELTLIACGVALAACLLPSLGQPRGGGPKSHCCNRLKQIATALQNYHSVYGCPPPAYVADEQGRPMHSWRVLLLPFMELGAIYDQYDFNEPWSGPNNSKVGNDPDIARCFQCPGERNPASPLETSYVVVVGPQTAWPGATSLDPDSVSDGFGNTLSIVEIKDSGIHWMEPRDLNFQTLTMRINPQGAIGLSSNHRDGCHTACCDGSVRFLPADIRPADLRALLTRARGERMPRINR